MYEKNSITKMIKIVVFLITFCLVHYSRFKDD